MFCATRNTTDNKSCEHPRHSNKWFLPQRTSTSTTTGLAPIPATILPHCWQTARKPPKAKRADTGRGAWQHWWQTGATTSFHKVMPQHWGSFVAVCPHLNGTIWVKGWLLFPKPAGQVQSMLEMHCDSYCGNMRVWSLEGNSLVLPECCAVGFARFFLQSLRQFGLSGQRQDTSRIDETGCKRNPRLLDRGCVFGNSMFRSKSG